MNLWLRIKMWWLQKRLNYKEYQRRQSQKHLIKMEEYEELYNDKLLEEYQRQKYLNKLHDLKKSTYTKKMTTWILGICILDIQLTYVLAFFGLGEKLVELSINLTRTILGVAFVYMIRAYFDSRAEHNNLDDEAMAKMQARLSHNINGILKKAGLSTIDTRQIADPAEGEKSSRGFHININGVDISKAPKYQEEESPKLESLDTLQSELENEIFHDKKDG